MGLCERAWDEGEVLSVGQPVHAEVPVIQREHRPEILALGETDEGGICQVHGLVSVLSHEGLKSWDVLRAQGRNVKGLTLQRVPKGILGNQ